MVNASQKAVDALSSMDTEEQQRKMKQQTENINQFQRTINEARQNMTME